MGEGNFRSPQNPHPKKFVASDYVGDPYSCAKFGANPSTGGLWANGWNISKFFIYLFIYLYLFFINSPTGQTRRRIFTLDGSNDADSRKDVPFYSKFHVIETNASISTKFGTAVGVADVITSNKFFGVWILWGSKIALSHWQCQSPLTQGWRYRAARDECS